MAGTLPTVRGGMQALCPVTRRVEFLTDIAIANNFTEQRSKGRPPLTRFVLPYTRVSATETAAFKAFMESQKGSFDSTWSFTLGTTTFTGLTSEDDTFTAREDAATPTLYSFTLRARQTKNAGQTAGSPGALFPTLASGASAQLPYTQVRRFAVLLNDNPTGMRYAYTWIAAGLTGYPGRSLRGWELQYPIVSDADLATREGHFRDNWGKWGTWTFVDPDASALLTAGISSGATSIPVSSVLDFPATPFLMQIDAEWLNVTAAGSSPLTATRGASSTTAAAHLAGAPVRVVYPKCRYDDDALEIVNNGPDQNSFTLRIVETN